MKTLSWYEGREVVTHGWWRRLLGLPPKKKVEWRRKHATFEAGEAVTLADNINNSEVRHIQLEEYLETTGYIDGK